MKAVLLILGVVLAVALGALLILAAGFSARIAQIEADLAAHPPRQARDDLPPMVRAFGERGMAGDRPGAAVRLTQAAEMRLKPGADWTPLDARQVIAAPVSGFAWVAQMRIGPLPAVRVIDSYADGAGLLEVRALGALRIGLSDGPDAALGEAMRYLAELPWVPDAILTNPEITWAETPDGVTARVETAGGPAEVTFTFDAAGDITEMRAAARPTTLADGTAVTLPWIGRFEDYGEIGGRRIPRFGEIGYDYPDGYEAYWRGRIITFEVVAGGA